MDAATREKELPPVLARGWAMAKAMDYETEADAGLICEGIKKTFEFATFNDVGEED